MKRNPMLCLGSLFLLVIPVHSGPALPPSANHPAYRHAYYLFLAGPPTGCEDCYVPLLITAEPLDQLAKAKGPEPCVLIITYERDSIWHADRIVSLVPGDIEAAPRIVHLEERKYRYQEITSSEVLQLLQNPLGTIPVSRPFVADTGTPGPAIEELISDFKK